MADSENKLTPISTKESTSSESSIESSASEQQKPDRIVAGRGVGGEITLNPGGLKVGGGEAYGARIDWDELSFLRERTGAVTIGGGIGRGAELPGVKARMEEEKREKARKDEEWSKKKKAEG